MTCDLIMTSYGRQTSGGGASGLGSRRGPPLASIESLLSFEAKSTPRSEFGHHIPGGPGMRESDEDAV